MVAAATMRIARAMRKGVKTPAMRSKDMRCDPETEHNDDEEHEQEPAEIFIEQIPDRLAIIFKQQCEREEPRAPGDETEQNEKRQAIAQKPAGDGDELERNGR